MKTHIVNHLASLGKIFPNEDLINKVLRCLSRQWQLKVTAIAESKDLTNMSLATLWENSRTGNGDSIDMKRMTKRRKELHSKPHLLLFMRKMTKKTK